MDVINYGEIFDACKLVLVVHAPQLPPLGTMISLDYEVFLFPVISIIFFTPFVYTQMVLCVCRSIASHARFGTFFLLVVLYFPVLILGCL